MISNRMFRLIHTSNGLWQTSTKTLLAELRKKTGYTFANCKKALEMHENDVQKAEKWLKDQAQALGWSKATKVQGRTTSQGLIAVISEKNHAALVEINCETDFVARNKHFQELAEKAAAAALKYAMSVTGGESVNRVNLDSDALKTLQALDGKTLADHSALIIGTVGENLGMRRALCMSAADGISLCGYAHPAPITPAATVMGKYGALVAFRAAGDNELLGRQLCQHVVGMNPSKIGRPGIDEPNPSADEESAMIHQEFLLDPTITVQDLLVDVQAEILDFARFEMGEVLTGVQSLESVETCG